MYYAKFLTHLRFARSRRQSSAGRMDRSKLVRGAVWRRGGRDVGLCARRLLPHTDLAAYRISGCNGRLCVVWLLAALWARRSSGISGSCPPATPRPSGGRLLMPTAYSCEPSVDPSVVARVLQFGDIPTANPTANSPQATTTASAPAAHAKQPRPSPLHSPR